MKDQLVPRPKPSQCNMKKVQKRSYPQTGFEQRIQIVSDVCGVSTRRNKPEDCKLRQNRCETLNIGLKTFNYNLSNPESCAARGFK
jgi:hypothetical protein